MPVLTGGGLDTKVKDTFDPFDELAACQLLKAWMIAVLLAPVIVGSI
jgi:hypothetical protein